MGAVPCQRQADERMLTRIATNVHEFRIGHESCLGTVWSVLESMLLCHCVQGYHGMGLQQLCDLQVVLDSRGLLERRLLFEGEAHRDKTSERREQSDKQVCDKRALMERHGETGGER